MKRFIFSLLFCAILSMGFSVQTFAQGSTFSDKNVEYTFDLPEDNWKMTTKPSVTNPNVEYVYNDRMDGFLEISKISVKPEEIMSDVIQRQTEQKLQYKPGFVAGKEENFEGALRGRVSNYEYSQSGKTMSGRIYFLKVDNNTVYMLKFTGVREQLRTLRNQTDSIARTFKVKAA